MLPFPGCARLLPSARGAISGRRLRRRYSGKAAGTLRSCWSVNSPGDREDREGRPFAGPAARILDVALREVGIDRSDVYVTNVVKHFRWQGAAPGKRRIHKKPRASEINACRPWLEDRKSTRLNSSHLVISYAVFCVKKKTGAQPRTLGVETTSPCRSVHACLDPAREPTYPTAILHHSLAGYRVLSLGVPCTRVPPLY